MSKEKDLYELKDGFEVSSEDGVATLKYKNEDAYFETSDMSKADLKKAADHNKKYLESMTQVASNAIKSQFEKDDKIKKVEVHAPYSVSKRGGVHITSHRQKDFPIPGKDEVSSKTTLQVNTSDPSAAPSKGFVKELSNELTEAIING